MSVEGLAALLRRITVPWFESRESMTLFSGSAQNGHFTGQASLFA